PGLRSPGAADPEELAVRIVLGGPPERAAELVRAYGKPLDAVDGRLTHLFPTPGELTGEEVPEPVRTLCTALADGTVVLDAGADRYAAERALAALPGVGAEAAAYIRMRALGDPDVGDAGGSGEGGPVGERAVAGAWRPWGAYAVHHLWRAGLLPAGELSVAELSGCAGALPGRAEETGRGREAAPVPVAVPVG
ncbi:DNA-3-methyladenine glycosylase 2 family protein, partial [Streptomyces lydicus]